MGSFQSRIVQKYILPIKLLILMQRELNELEFLTYTLGQPYNIAMVVTLRGTIDDEKLRDAFKKLQLRHPLLSVKVVCNEKGIPWFYSNEKGEIPLTIAYPESADFALHLLEKELSTPFEMTGPLPLARAILIPHAQHTQLILCMQHVISDGLSFAFVIKDLLSLLAEPDVNLDRLSITENLARALPQKIANKIPRTARKFKILFLLVKIMHRIKNRKSSVKTQLPDKSKDRSYRIHSWSLNANQTASLLARCKQERVSVHSALCTAFLFFNSIINNPVNLRNRLSQPVGESLGLFASGAVVKMKYNPHRNFWENARHYHRKLQKELSDKKVFSIYKIVTKVVPIPMLQRFGSIFIDLASNQQPFAITNLGDLDRLGIPSESGTLQLESFFGGVSAGSIDAVTISIYTLRKELHFNVNYYAYMAELWDFPKIASTAMNNLIQAI